ncbi:45529_t:CDS:2 [Gigaspora margarita]|uniref:protein-serine/threonine phosphatase n=1 Tax=Gigaspora margarita TaxID=4874 RepID=A0ABN7UIS3_GIGMA|nr:45529_t:CDS:2 [Gigaspora margarita]
MCRRAIVTPNNEIYVGNAGDSRAVLSEDGVAIPMSDDHKPTNPGESKRITEAGGFVDIGRVNGNLALSRALGDFEFKKNTNLSVEKQIVTGIWDCLKSQEVISFIRKNIAEHKDLKRACEDLMERCLSKTNEVSIGTDNMTIIIVGFLHNKTETEWYKWMASRYGVKGFKYKEDIFEVDLEINYGDYDDSVNFSVDSDNNSNNNSDDEKEDLTLEM